MELKDFIITGVGLLIISGLSFLAGINYSKCPVCENIVNMSCSIYPNGTMCCAPLIERGNMTLAFMPPYPERVEKVYICEYNTTISDFANCTKIFERNTTKEK